MKNIIICEGGTDLALIQYFMEKANQWMYANNTKEISDFKDVKNFTKGEKKLTIAATGGCSKICKCFESVIEKNKYSALEEEKFDNVIIISDRDEINTLNSFDTKIRKILSDYAIEYDGNINNDEWIQCLCLNGRNIKIQFKLLLLIIPFEETGAIETFLLNSIAGKDIYDKKIIEESTLFAENVDTEERYLKKRRHKTKAKFDIYFSIRTPLEQFSERRNILKNIDWEKYEDIQIGFKKLNSL